MTPVAGRRLLAAVALIALVLAPATLLASAGPRASIPPPTPVPPNGRLSPFPRVLHTPADPIPAPDLAADGALLADLDTGSILYERAVDTPRPIASVTKIMTALLVVERTRPTDVVTVAPEAVFARDDYGAGSTLGLRAGERLRVEDLLYGLVLGSANDAAEALAIHVSGSVRAFVADMNVRAQGLGMGRTTFASPHGLDDDGVSTPRDLLRLARAAASHPSFAAIAASRSHTIPSPHGPDRRIQNRNALLWLYPGTTGMKTGFTQRAGACLVATAERDGRRLVAIVLHADEEAFSDAATLLQHGFEGFVEAVLVRAGEEQGTVRVRGGRVPAAAGATLERLVPAAQVGDVSTDIRVDPRAAFPPVPGERIGTVLLRLGERSIGRVPLLAGLPPAPLPLEGRWWTRALQAIARAGGDAVRGLAT